MEGVGGKGGGGVHLQGAHFFFFTHTNKKHIQHYILRNTKLWSLLL